MRLPPDPYRCRAIVETVIANPRRCRRRAEPIGPYCHQHAAQDAAGKLFTPRPNARETLDRIAAALDGETWSPDTLDEIADAMRAGGYELREPDEAEP